MSEKERLAYKLFCQDIISTPLPIDHQEAVQRDGHIWCVDWWNIEVLKFLFLGEERYIADPLPRRLRNNPLFDRSRISSDAEAKLSVLEMLRNLDDRFDTLLVCEVSRGIDILVASLAKSWKTIYAYDKNPYVMSHVERYFRDRLGLNLTTWVLPSENLVLPSDRPLAIVGNNLKATAECPIFQAANEPDVALILDGKLHV